MGGGEGKGRFRKAVAKTTLLRQMSRKVLPVTNESSEDRRRRKQGSGRAQMKQRAGRVQLGDLYFSMLDMSWGTMLSYCCVAYVCTVALWAGVTLAVADDIDGSALSLSSKPFVRSLAFACENIVTMGWGLVAPRSTTTFALGVLQHLTGLALNVLVFAIVCTKFQHPQSQLVFGDRACIVKRRGVPYLLVRLGNKRCNLIYHPDAKLSLLTPASTPEGESYVRNEDLEVRMPGVITGIYSIAHRIDAQSPLKAVLEDWGNSSARRAISVTFVGRDGVFHDDLHCIKRYSLSEDVVLDHRFVDATSFDEKTGLPRIDFEKISQLVPLSKPRAFAATRAQRMEKLRASLDEEPPMAPGLHLIYGSLRRSEDNPEQPLEMACSFSAMASMCLRHAGVPHQTILADTHHKPKWFEKRWFAALPESKKATFPAIIRVKDDGTSDFIGDSAAVVDAVCRWYPDAAAKLASAEGGLAGGTAAENMMASWFGAVSMASTCIEDHRDAEKRQAYADAKETWKARVRPLEDVLEKHAFLSGRDAPGRVDFDYFSLLRVAHEQFFAAWLDAEFAKELDTLFPRVVHWRHRIEPITRGAVSDTETALAITVLHVVSGYFPKCVPLLPRRYQELVDSLAGEPDDEDEEATDSQSPAGGGTIQFCL